MKLLPRDFKPEAPNLTPEQWNALWEEGRAMAREIAARFAKMKRLSSDDLSSRCR